MKNLFSISETAKIVNTTTETLRHYDRIDLVKPCKVDEWTGYRYYSPQEIVRLNTIKTLRYMDFTLSEIKNILSYNDFNKIVNALKQAEINADEKIAELNYAKTKIQRARLYYESKLTENQSGQSPFIKNFPKRTILLSETMKTPTLDNLFDYHRHFYNQLPENIKGEFSFEDSAGIYKQNGQQQLFAICTKYKQINGLKTLPQGTYLCANCTENNLEQTTKSLIEIAKNKYHIVPEFTLQLVIVSGILQWNYQVQVFISNQTN